MGVAEIETSPFWGHSSPSGLDEDWHNAFCVVVRPWSCVFSSRFYFVALNLTMFSGCKSQLAVGCGGLGFRSSGFHLPSKCSRLGGLDGEAQALKEFSHVTMGCNAWRVCTFVLNMSTSKYRCAIDVRSIWYILSKNALFQQKSKAMVHMMPRCSKNLKKIMTSWEPKGAPQCNRRNMKK